MIWKYNATSNIPNLNKLKHCSFVCWSHFFHLKRLMLNVLCRCLTNVGSWWNLYRRVIRMLPFIWHHLQVCQEPPCPPKLQEGTWRTGKVLIGFLTFDLDEIFDSNIGGLKHVIWHHFQNLHVPPCLPRLQIETIEMNLNQLIDRQIINNIDYCLS